MCVGVCVYVCVWVHSCAHTRKPKDVGGPALFSPSCPFWQDFSLNPELGWQPASPSDLPISAVMDTHMTTPVFFFFNVGSRNLKSGSYWVVSTLTPQLSSRAPVFVFWDKVSYSLGWSWTHYVGEVDLELLILLPPPKCSAIKEEKED